MGLSKQSAALPDNTLVTKQPEPVQLCLSSAAIKDTKVTPIRYNPSFPALFSLNRLPSLMYRRTI
jgi:hypothetical protein